MSIFVFLGSSLTPARAAQVLDAHYLPPAQQGDILRLLPRKPRVIGIVDGLFGAVPAVWHKEVLSALEQGCHVFGAASMGALRAAELSAFGMRGVGRIFEAFRDGELEDDDEVAVSHASADFGFRELSVAMVNLRDRLQRAERQGLLEPSETQALTAYAKSLHYPDRSFERVLARARQWGWPKERLSALQACFDSGEPLLKERDARRMLEQIRDFVSADPPRAVLGQALSVTTFLRELHRDVSNQRTPRRTFDGDASVAHTGLSLADLRREVLLQLLSRAYGPQLGIFVASDEVEMAAEQLAQAASWKSESERDGWLDSVGMTPESLAEALRDIVRCKKVELRLAQRVERALPDIADLLGLLHGGA